MTEALYVRADELAAAVAAERERTERVTALLNEVLIATVVDGHRGVMRLRDMYPTFRGQSWDDAIAATIRRDDA